MTATSASGRGIENSRILLAAAPLDAVESVDAEMNEAGELHLLPGELARVGGDARGLLDDGAPIGGRTAEIGGRTAEIGGRWRVLAGS